MNDDDLSEIRLDRDPDDLLPEDWDDDTNREIELAGIRRLAHRETSHEG